jgi:hypothetical protein
MLDHRDLNARGIRIREAIATLLAVTSDPQLSLEVQYVRATVNNLLFALEQDAGVLPSYFGSFGAPLLELNPFSGLAMPAAVSMEPPPAFDAPSQAPLAPPAAPPDS